MSDLFQSEIERMEEVVDEGDRWTLQADIANAKNMSIYASGYELAEKTLFDRLRQQEGGGDIDLIVYPWIFLMRHNVELLIKSIQRTGHQLGLRDNDFDQTHRLGCLWKDTVDFLEDEDVLEAPKLQELKQDVKPCIEWLTENDESSYVFRYPENLKQVDHLPKTKRIDVVDVRKKYLRAMQALSGLQMNLEDWRAST